MKKHIKEIMRAIESWNLSDLESLESEIDTMIDGMCIDCGWTVKNCNCKYNE